MEKTLEELTVQEIKAMLYDQIVLLEQTRSNIQTLQQALGKKVGEQK